MAEKIYVSDKPELQHLFDQLDDGMCLIFGTEAMKYFRASLIAKNKKSIKSLLDKFFKTALPRLKVIVLLDILIHNTDIAEKILNNPDGLQLLKKWVKDNG